MNSPANLTHANLVQESLTARVGPAKGLPGDTHLLQTVFERSVVGMLIAGSDGRFLSVNQAFCDLIGYTVEEVLACTMHDITHPDDIALSEETLRSLVSGQTQICQIEKRYIHKSGRTVWVLLTLIVIPHTDPQNPNLIVLLAKNIGRRKAAEESLQRSEALFRAIGENAGDPILIVDYPGLNMLYVSPAFEKYLGYSRDDLEGRKSLEIVHPDDGPTIQRGIESMAREGENGVIAELRYRHKNGNWHYVEAHGCAVRNGDGELERLVVISRLIDDRRMAQKLMKEREERLHLLLNSTAEAIYGVYTSGNCTFCNQALLRMLGYKSAGELLGRNIHEVLHHSHADGSPYPMEECIIFQAFRTSSMMHVDDEIVWRADGTWFPVEYWSHPVQHEGKTVGCMVTFVDITERKAAQEALRRAHEGAELFINSVPSMLIGIGRDSRIKRWNSAAEQVFGLTAEEVTGKPLATCGIQWVRTDMQLEIESWCAGRDALSLNVLPFAKEGETRFLGLNLKWINAPEEEVDELLIIGSDVTEREILGQQLRQAQKLEGIGQLAPGIAHEINTPIQYVGDNTRFLKESWASFQSLLAITHDMQQEATLGRFRPRRCSV